MTFNLKILLGSSLIALCLAVSPLYASMDLSLKMEDISWETSAGMVLFTLRFQNPDIIDSAAATGTLTPSRFGAFLNPGTLAHTFAIPPIPPESFFDVFVEISLGDLPPTAAEILPWNDSSPGLPCLPNDHWDGNVDVIWTGPNGGGTVASHNGTLQVCIGFIESFIHISTESPLPTSWVILGPYCGLNPWLLNEDFSSASNPLPPGWSGWVRVIGDWNAVPGTVCPRTLRMYSGTEVVNVNLELEICDCSVIPNEDRSWGSIKSFYR